MFHRILILVVVAMCFMRHYSEGTVVVVDYNEQLKNIDLFCDEAPEEANVTWFKGNDTLVADKKSYELFPNHTLRILKIESSFIVEYMCKYGDREMSFDIKVRPYIKKFDKVRNVIEGESANFECPAWGVPEPKITWYRGTTQLIPDGSGKIVFKVDKDPEAINSAGFPKIVNGTIRITNMNSSEADNYTCFAESIIDNERFITNGTLVVVIKDKYAALWVFIGICIEVAVLCTIILIYERHRSKRIEEEERKEEAALLNGNETKLVDSNDAVRQRKM